MAATAGGDLRSEDATGRSRLDGGGSGAAIGKGGHLGEGVVRGELALEGEHPTIGAADYAE